MKEVLRLVFEKIRKNVIFQKLLIKKIENFFGKTAVHVSSPYSGELSCAKAKKSLEPNKYGRNLESKEPDRSS